MLPIKQATNSKTMNNAEYYKKIVKKAYEKGILDYLEQNFFKIVIERRDNKGLRELKSEQFRLLRSISEKYEVAVS